MSLLNGVFVAWLLIAIAAAWWFWPRAPRATDLRAELARRTRGDTERAERLADLERARAPGISDKEAYKRALDRLMVERR